MLHSKLLGALIGVACLSLSSLALANPYRIDFSANHFVTQNGHPAPQSTVSGWISYEAAYPGAAVSAITGIDLTIAGYSYRAGEITADPHFIDFFSERRFLGYLFGAGRADTLAAGSNDFWFMANGGPSEMNFAYQTADMNDIWMSDVKLGARPVPEPTSIALALLGLAGLAGARRRKQAK